MKFKTPYKTVMFYGNVLHIPYTANWIAAFPSGRIAAFMEKPDCNSQDNKWDNRGTTWSPDVHAEMEDIKWEDTLTYCPQDQGWNSLHATWDSWIKHAVPNYLRNNVLTNQLRERLFPLTKEPEYRVIKGYYGRDLIVPPQARWIAMDINGKTHAYETEPVLRVGCWRENINGEEECIPVAWFPPEIAAQHWQDSLMEIQL